MSSETVSANSAGITLAAAQTLDGLADGQAVINRGRVAFELAFTVLLIGALLYGALYLVPALSAKPPQPIGSILIATLLPIGILIFLSSIERLLPPAGPRKSIRKWFIHLQMNVFWAFMAGFTAVFATMAAEALARHFGFSLGLIDLRFAEGNGFLALIGAVWLSAIAGDLVFYWYHRTLHKSSILWQLHKLHHMDPELDVLTVNRDNWIDTIAAAVLIFMPMGILFKLDNLAPWELGLVGGSIATAFSTLLALGHMNVKFQVGKASLFYCSPQMHRIHHSRLPQHRDKNFAFILPLWDIIFGTYYAPAPDEFPPTGVDGEKDFQSFWEAQIFTPREWWKMFRVWRERKTQSLGRV